MSNVAEFSMEICLQDMPYEILFEIFRELPKGKLIGISRLCSKFRNIAGDTRLWKNVYIKYKSYQGSKHVVFAFEELYSEPWPVRVVDLSETHVEPPATPETAGEVVKVKRLNLSSITANEVTTEAILTKFQCTELYLDNIFGISAMAIRPKAFSKQTALEVLTLKNFRLEFRCNRHWLASILSYCKNLKTLDLSTTYLTNVNMSSFVKNLPTSLEKLFLVRISPKGSFLKWLSKSTPNLKELKLGDSNIECPSLLEFQLLETLHIFLFDSEDISGLHMYLVKFPALKTVYIEYHPRLSNLENKDFEALQRTLEPNGIIAERIEKAKEEPLVDGNMWEVSKTV